MIYRRGEFEMAGFRKVLEVNLISLMACAMKFHADAEGEQGLADHRLVHRRLSRHRQPRLQRLEDRRGGPDPHAGEAWAEDGIRVNGIAPGLVDTKMTKVTTANPKRLEGAIERFR